MLLFTGIELACCGLQHAGAESQGQGAPSLLTKKPAVHLPVCTGEAAMGLYLPWAQPLLEKALISVTFNEKSSLL